jgi:hypothetical protein
MTLGRYDNQLSRYQLLHVPISKSASSLNFLAVNQELSLDLGVAKPPRVTSSQLCSEKVQKVRNPPGLEQE